MSSTLRVQNRDPARWAFGRAMWVLIPFILAVAGVTALLTWPSGRIGSPAAPPPPVPPAPDGPPPPAGYSVAGARTEGFRAFLPGAVTPEWRVRKSVTPGGVVSADPTTAHWFYQTGRDRDVSAAAYAVRLAAPVPADALWGELVRTDPFVASPALTVEGKAPATLGGLPALEVRVVENANWMYEHHPNEVTKPDEAAVAAMQQKAKRWVYYVAADDRRAYVVRLEAAGRYPDPEMTATVTGSFQLLR